MMLAFGWFVVRAARRGYSEDMEVGQMEALDERFRNEDERLWKDLEAWLSANDDGLMTWRFQRHLNNHRGLLEITVSRNHRASPLWDLIKWLANASQGTYGIVYVHDDEDCQGVTHYGRGQLDHDNEFRVWVVKRGTVSEHQDPFLSPIVPEVGEFEP